MPSLHSERIGAELHLGKLPARAVSTDHVPISDLLKAVSGQLPPLHANFGHGLAFGKTGWGMDGNGPAGATTTIPAGYTARSGAGDCYWAGTAHDIRQDAKVNGNPIPRIGDGTVIGWYAQHTGYDPESGSGDNGTDPQDGLKVRQTDGLKDDDGNVHRIGATVALEPGNLEQLYYAAWLFEKAGVGVEFQQAQMDQFDQQKPWEYVQGSAHEGGHWIIVESRNGLVSWGERVGYVPSWYEHLNDESFAWVPLEAYNRVTGETAEHWRQTDLEKYVVMLPQVTSAA